MAKRMINIDEIIYNIQIQRDEILTELEVNRRLLEILTGIKERK